SVACPNHPSECSDRSLRRPRRNIPPVEPLEFRTTRWHRPAPLVQIRPFVPAAAIESPMFGRHFRLFLLCFPWRSFRSHERAAIREAVPLLVLESLDRPEAPRRGILHPTQKEPRRTFRDATQH